MSKVIADHSAYLVKRLLFHQQRAQYEGNFSLDTFFVNVMAAGHDLPVGDGTPVWCPLWPPPTWLLAGAFSDSSLCTARKWLLSYWTCTRMASP